MRNLIPKIVLLGLLGFVGASLNAVGTERDQVVDKEHVRALLNWAVFLSRYEKPDDYPAVKFVSHEFLVKKACYSRECQVIGWYNDQSIIYLDRKLMALESLFSRSVLVHEMVHYLQHKSYEYGDSCDDFVEREAEAYEIQRRFFFAYGSIEPIQRKVFSCDERMPGKKEPVIVSSEETF